MSKKSRIRNFSLDVLCWQDGKVVHLENFFARYDDWQGTSSEVVARAKADVKNQLLPFYERVTCTLWGRNSDLPFKVFELQRQETPPPPPKSEYPWRREYTQGELLQWYRRQFRCCDIQA